MFDKQETPERFVHAMGAAATGVSIVTTAGEAGRFGLTVSAIASVSADPPLLLACINRRNPSVTAVDANGYFAVNILGEQSQEVAEIFAGRAKSGLPYDFNRHDWVVGLHGLPILADSAAYFECTIEQASDAGTHRIYIGRVLSAVRNQANPLVYSNRAFGRVAPQ